MDFTLAAGGYVYRPLKLTTPVQRGFDVYALQTALMAYGLTLPQFGADGYLGAETSRSIRTFQDTVHLTADGVAGILTQQALGSRLCLKVEKALDLPHKLMYGAVENECGWQLGNHTAAYENGSRDLGPVEKNCNPADSAACAIWFDVLPAIRALGDFIKARHDKYVAAGNISDRRAWELAVAAWNRPAWADTLARGGTITPEQKAWVEQYISRACAYVEW